MNRASSDIGIVLSCDCIKFLCEENPNLKQFIQSYIRAIGGEHYIILEDKDLTEDYYVASTSFENLDINRTELAQRIFSAFEITWVEIAKNSIVSGLNGTYYCLSIPLDVDKQRKRVFLIVFNQMTEVIDSIIKQIEMVLENYFKDYEFDVHYEILKTQQISESELINLGKRSFSVAAYHPSASFFNMFCMFVSSGIAPSIGINSTKLFRFLVQVRKNYHNVPYHNWYHALDATQFVFSLISNTNIREMLLPEEVFGLLLATVCHDIDHDGLNNKFQRNSNSLFSQLSLNLPPLEHHHASMAFDLSRDLLDGNAHNSSITKYMIQCIMATDMEAHNQFLTDFKTVMEGFDKSNDSHRILLGQISIKGADLSNTVRDFEEAMRLSKCLMNEYFIQGDLEKQKGLPVSPYCNRDDNTPLCVGQIGFYTYVADPLMNQIHCFFKTLTENHDQFKKNLQKWTDMKDNQSR